MSRLFFLSSHQNRIWGLDLLRALAIIFVMLEHGKGLLPKQFHKLHDYFTFDGVSIFFVLSGFLIGGILIRKLEKEVTDAKFLFSFWIRRWMRTLPNYFLILLLLIGLSSFGLLEHPWDGNYSFFFFTQNMWQSHPAFFSEAWSLSVEEWFYLLLPMALLALIRFLHFKPKQALLFFALLLIVAILGLRYLRFLELGTSNHWQWDLLFRKQVLMRLDSLMFGLLGAYVYQYFRNFWLAKARLFLIVGIALLILNKWMFLHTEGYGLYHCVFFFSINALGTLFLLPALSAWKQWKGFAFRFLTMISLISYSLYLINLSIIRELIIFKLPIFEWIGVPLLAMIIRYVLFWGLSIICSLLLYQYFELPMMRLRDMKLKQSWRRLARFWLRPTRE